MQADCELGRNFRNVVVFVRVCVRPIAVAVESSSQLATDNKTQQQRNVERCDPGRVSVQSGGLGPEQ